MAYSAAALLVLVLHLGFILFVVFGAILVLRRPPPGARSSNSRGAAAP